MSQWTLAAPSTFHRFWVRGPSGKARLRAVGGLLCTAVLIGFFVWVITKAVSPGQYARLLKVGMPARGILLQVNSTQASKFTSGGIKYETRQVTIDVEIPGTPPYEMACALLIPSQLRNDILPGATVELRVDPKNRKSIAVIGPGAGLIGTTN